MRDVDASLPERGRLRRRLPVWPVPALAHAHLAGGAARAPHGHRRARTMLRPLPQRQLPTGVPLLQLVSNQNRKQPICLHNITDFANMLEEEEGFKNPKIV